LSGKVVKRIGKFMLGQVKLVKSLNIPDYKFIAIETDRVYQFRF